MTGDVERWLEALDLSKYRGAFAANEIAFEDLAELTEDDLKEMGLPIGPRRRVLKAIAELDVANRTSPAASGPSVGQPATSSPAVERRQLTVMFCDLVGSTALSQRLDPEDLREVLRRYQDGIAGAVSQYGGHVAKYLGDGVLAYFGWPQAYEDQAERAVRAGLAAVRSVADIPGGDDSRLQARVGIDTGQVVVGDLIGKIGRDVESISGETPNLAARLQQAADPNQVVVGGMTRRLIGQTFVVRDLGTRELKGFAEPVSVWSVEAEAKLETRFEALHGGLLTRLFGREPELGLLLERWTRTKTDGGQVVVLSGEAGIGKSRLVQALTEHVTGESCFRLRYQCFPHQSNSAFHPVIRHLERTARFADADSDADKLDKLEALLGLSGTDISAIAPLFAMLMAVPAEDRYGALDLEPRQIRERTFEALIGQVLNLARRQPVLFVFEDAHWVDPSTEALIGGLMERIVDVPVLMLITHRPDYAPPWANYAHLTSVTVNRLSGTQAERIVRTLAGEDLPEVVAKQIVARADGVPLYVEELTKSVLESGAGTGTAGVENAIPVTLQASLAARLDRLGEGKEIAQIGAVIGREFPHQLVTALADMDAAAVDSGLARLVRSGLAFKRGMTPDTRYVFKHALIQDAAYDGLLVSRRRELHGSLVSKIEQFYRGHLDDHAELLAFHAQRGELWQKALDYCRMAGRRANERSAYKEALRFLEAGLAAAGQLPETQEILQAAIDIRLSMRPSLGAFGRYERFLEMLSEADVAAQRLGDGTIAAHVSMEKTHVLYHTGHVLEAVQEGRKAVSMARDVNHHRLIIGAANNLAMALFFRGELRKAAMVAGEHAEALKNEFRYDQLGTTVTSSANWLVNLAAMHAMLGTFDAALNHGEEASKIAEETGKPGDIAQVAHWNGFIHISMDNLPAAFRYLKRAFQLVEENGLEFWYTWVAIHLGTAFALSNQPDRAEVLLSKAIENGKRLGLLVGQIWGVALLANAKTAAGLPAAGIEHASSALELARGHGYQWLEVLALQQLGQGSAWLGSDHVEEAESYFNQAIELADRLEARLYLAHAERGIGDLYRSTGQTADASKHLRSARDLYESMGLESWLNKTNEALAGLA